MDRISSNPDDPKRNASGYLDLTAYEAMKHTEEESERFHKLLEIIFNICELSGFHLENRIVVKDLETGKVWR